MLEALQIFLAFYFILLALSAAWGVHRPLLLLPGRILYSLLQLLLFAVSFGRVRLLPLAQKSSVDKKSLKQAVDDLQEITLPEIKNVAWKKDEKTD